MKFSRFQIQNFKGIEKIDINLDKSPDANVYTLVGLNESGKTTILEALNIFSPSDEGVSALELPGSTINDFNSLIPISRRDNFNDTISIIVTLKLSEEDIKKIGEFVRVNTSFKKIKPVESITYYRYYRFKDSKFIELDSRWSGFYGILKTESKSNFINIGKEHLDDNFKIYRFCRGLIPSILYFPNFLFEFPSKIFLETKEQPTAKEKFYIDLIQDILNSLENNTNIQTHLIDRIKSNIKSDKNNLDRLRQLMERKVTDIVFGEWSRIFKKTFKDRKVVIRYDDEDGFSFLEFKIEAPDGTYQINEKSLGFRWFFVFLLFTQFRPFRKDAPKNIIFLFDEPASNLHSNAQKQLLKSFESLIHNSKIIYTTHSHHLINPHWLESTYVVKNEGIQLDDIESYSIKNTNITIEPYREFVVRHPHNTAYFQPILDVLDYTPSNLEILPNCVFMEGKNDYYTIEYFQNVVLSRVNKINFSPSTGSGSLDTLISLYIGWGKEFFILLDSDKEGNNQKDRYVKAFGILVERRIFTLEDIDVGWKKMEMEKLFDASEALKFQQISYPASVSLNKTHFNRAIQESLIAKRKFPFNDNTEANFDKILTFFQNKLGNPVL